MLTSPRRAGGMSVTSAAIAGALRRNETLECLLLRSNKLGDDGARLLAEVLKANTSLIPFAAVLDGRQPLPWREFVRPAQLGIAIAVGVFWWAHQWIGVAATSFARTGFAHWLDGAYGLMA